MRRKQEKRKKRRRKEQERKGKEEWRETETNLHVLDEFIHAPSAMPAQLGGGLGRASVCTAQIGWLIERIETAGSMDVCQVFMSSKNGRIGDV